MMFRYLIKIYFFTLLLFLTPLTNSQSSANLRLLRNLNTHSLDGNYSACWGYTAPDNREYAILGCNAGTSFVDVTDTNNIHEVDYRTRLKLMLPRDENIQPLRLCCS